jgi:hypothetical protein
VLGAAFLTLFAELAMDLADSREGAYRHRDPRRNVHDPDRTLRLIHVLSASTL